MTCVAQNHFGILLLCQKPARQAPFPMKVIFILFKGSCSKLCDVEFATMFLVKVRIYTYSINAERP
jgi:hypothetical protein